MPAAWFSTLVDNHWVPRTVLSIQKLAEINILWQHTSSLWDSKIGYLWLSTTILLLPSGFSLWSQKLCPHHYFKQTLFFNQYSCLNYAFQNVFLSKFNMTYFIVKLDQGYLLASSHQQKTWFIYFYANDAFPSFSIFARIHLVLWSYISCKSEVFPQLGKYWKGQFYCLTESAKCVWLSGLTEYSKGYPDVSGSVSKPQWVSSQLWLWWTVSSEKKIF